MASDTQVSIEQRVARLEAEREIIRTLNDYATAHYNGDLDKYLDCFVPDGVQEHPGGVSPVAGHDQLSDRFGRNSHAPNSFHKIITFQPAVLIDGDMAKVESDWILFQGGRSVLYVSVFGHYSDELVKQDDGRWRIRVRKVTTEGRTGEPPGSVVEPNPG